MKRSINQAAVLGAGVMGSGIAALLASAGIRVTLLDVVPAELNEGEMAKGLTKESKAFRNRFAQNGYDRIKDPKTGMLLDMSRLGNIKIGNMTDDLELLKDQDWIIEVVVERAEVKRSVMAQVERYRKKGSIVSTNTSGVPINEICAGMSEEFRAHFMGTHFFNPPRYTKLFELIPAAETKQDVVRDMAEFAEHELGKAVVLAKDTPNFIGNRIGCFTANHTIQLALKYNFNIPTVDLLTGTVMGRPKSGTYRTMDLVGIDINQNVANNVLNNSTDQEELAMYEPPAFLKDLLEAGAVGDKAGQGFYKKTVKDGKKEILAYDPVSKSYQQLTAIDFPSVKNALRSENKYEAMAYGDGEENHFVWELYRDILLYSAGKIPEISDDYKMIDRAMEAGYNWEAGPFRIWDALGVEKSVEKMEAEGKVVPEWVKQRLKEGKTRFYEETKEDQPYLKLRSCDMVASSKDANIRDLGDGVLCFEMTSKGSSITENVHEMFFHAFSLLEGNDWRGMVIGHEGKNFCNGANLTEILEAAKEGRWKEIEKGIRRLQKVTSSIKYAPRPIVAAPFGMTLGGGTELTLHSAAAVADAETYMGLVECGVGLVPAGGGCKELLVKLMDRCADEENKSRYETLKRLWKLLANGVVTKSGADAKEKGFLTKGTHIVMNRPELLERAKKKVLELEDWGYHPPMEPKIKVMGDYGRSELMFELLPLEEGKFMSKHDAHIARKIASIITGGDLPSGTVVNEQHILDLECEAFLSLLGEEKTQQRIEYMLQTGKRLAN